MPNKFETIRTRVGKAVKSFENFRTKTGEVLLGSTANESARMVAFYTQTTFIGIVVDRPEIIIAGLAVFIGSMKNFLFFEAEIRSRLEADNSKMNSEPRPLISE